MKAKSELKAALEALQVRKPLKLPSSAPTFAPPAPQLAHTDLQTPVPAATEVAPQTMVPVPTQVAVVTPVAHETMVPSESKVAAPTMVAVQTKVGPVSAGNQEEVRALVAAEAQAAPETLVPLETEVLAQTKDARETVVPGHTLVRVQTPVPTPTQVGTQTTAPAQTPLHGRAPVVGGTKAPSRGGVHPASEQDSAVVLEAQASPKLQHGYTRIPNALLMRMVGGDFLRSEMQVALLIGRLTISYQRRFSPISKAVVERQTGLRGPAVLQALSALVAKGVIEKIPGDQNRPNQFGLVGVEEWLPSPSNPPGAGPTLQSTPVPPATPASVPTTVVAPTGTVVSTGTTAPVSAEAPALVSPATSFKDSERYSDSLSRLPAKLREYFGGLKPARKRESEWKAFQELQNEYAGDDIADSFVFLQTRGIDSGDSTQPCHSPMAYLAKAIGEILPEVQDQRRKARERAERERREVEAERQRHEAEAREVAEWAAKDRAFKKAFPTEERQHEALIELLRSLPFSPKSRAGQILGVNKWWEGLNQFERLEVTE